MPSPHSKMREVCVSLIEPKKRMSTTKRSSTGRLSTARDRNARASSFSADAESAIGSGNSNLHF